MSLPLYSIEPSVICCDLCNLEQEIRRWESAGVQALHIDVLDGAFAPSLPVGIDTFQQLANKTDLPFDVHIMSRNNPWFIQECVKMHPGRICFQLESEPEPDRMVRMIRDAGISPGLAFSPETPVTAAGELLEQVDFVLLMRIKPGYAGFAQESVTVDMDRKIVGTRSVLDRTGSGKDLVVDGRVSYEDITRLRTLGATTFVGGSRSLFSSDDYAGNFRLAEEAYRKGSV